MIEAGISATSATDAQTAFQDGSDGSLWREDGAWHLTHTTIMPRIMPRSLAASQPHFCIHNLVPILSVGSY